MHPLVRKSTRDEQELSVSRRMDLGLDKGLDNVRTADHRLLVDVVLCSVCHFSSAVNDELT